MRSAFVAGVVAVALLTVAGLVRPADPCLMPAFRMPPVHAAYLRAFHTLVRQPERTTRFDALIVREAKLRGLDPRLLKAVMAAESGFEPRAVSPAGARGLMQVMPSTAKELGVRGSLHDPAVSIHAGAKYLALLHNAAYRKFGLQGSDYTQTPLWVQKRVVAAYNAGPRALSGQGWPKQTRLYVDKVIFFYRTDLAAVRMTPVSSVAAAR